MQFKKIEINNFGSFGEENIFELQDKGIVFVKGDNKETHGSNGAGKTMFLDAIVWTLTGMTTRGIKADGVVNRYTSHKKNTLCRLFVDEYEIIRARKHKTYKNQLIVKKDGEDITLGKTKETTQFLSKIFCITFETLVNSIILGANVNVNFLGTDNNKDRRKIFENILGIDKYPKYLEHVKTSKKYIDEQFCNIVNQIELKKQLIESCQTKIEENKQRQKDFEQHKMIQVKQLNEELKKCNNVDVDAEMVILKQYQEIISYNKDIEHKKETMIAEHKQKLTELTHKQEKFEQQKKDTQKILDEIEELRQYDFETMITNWKKIHVCNEKIQEMRAKDKALHEQGNDIIIEINKINDEIENQNKFIGTPCKTCGTLLDQQHILTVVKNLEKQQEELRTKSDALAKTTQKLQYKCMDVQEIINKITPEFTDAEIKVKQDILANTKLRSQDDLDLEINNIVQQIVQLNTTYCNAIENIGDIKECNKPNYDENDLIELKSKRDVMYANIKNKENEVNPYDAISFDSDISKATSDIMKLEKELNKVKEEKKYYEFWIEGFGNNGLKTWLFEEVLPYFNERIEYYLNILNSGLITLKFDNQLNYELNGCDYKSCSNGERKRLDLAVMFALFDLLNLRSQSSSNILILDELLDTLDNVGLEAVEMLIQDLNKRIGTIYCISHNNSLAENFPTTITIQKGIDKISTLL